MDEQHWAKMLCADGYYYWDADIAADPDVEKIMLRAQGNLTKEGYWRDIATDLADLIDRLKVRLRKLESAWEQAINLYPDLENIDYHSEENENVGQNK